MTNARIADALRYLQQLNADAREDLALCQASGSDDAPAVLAVVRQIAALRGPVERLALARMVRQDG